jgi:hypothetical protein
MRRVLPDNQAMALRNRLLFPQQFNANRLLSRNLNMLLGNLDPRVLANLNNIFATNPFLRGFVGMLLNQAIRDVVLVERLLGPVLSSPFLNGLALNGNLFGNASLWAVGNGGLGLTNGLGFPGTGFGNGFAGASFLNNRFGGYGSGYGAASYSMPYSGSYGGGGGGAGGGGYGQESMNMMPAYANMTSRPDYSGNESSASYLAALGIPTDRGRIRWPVGLEVLSPPSTNQELLKQLESLVRELAMQQATGQTNPQLAKSAEAVIGKLRVMLEERKERMFPSNYKEADRFLTFLSGNLKSLQY